MSKVESCPCRKDVAPVIHTTNLSAVAWCDKLICSNCGIVLQDWVEVRYDENMDDTTHHEYVFNYCPNCGAKIEEVEEREQ
nr:MAG TPA: Transcription initiation factor IIE, alpha FINGER, Transcription [Caudoviricetes sp.]